SGAWSPEPGAYFWSLEPGAWSLSSVPLLRLLQPRHRDLREDLLDEAVAHLPRAPRVVAHGDGHAEDDAGLVTPRRVGGPRGLVGLAREERRGLRAHRVDVHDGDLLRLLGRSRRAPRERDGRIVLELDLERLHPRSRPLLEALAAC